MDTTAETVRDSGHDRPLKRLRTTVLKSMIGFLPRKHAKGQQFCPSSAGIRGETWPVRSVLSDSDDALTEPSIFAS